jgi:hypothetical protein
MDLKKTAINKNIKADKDNSTVPLYGDIKSLRAGDSLYVFTKDSQTYLPLCFFRMFLVFKEVKIRVLSRPAEVLTG